MLDQVFDMLSHRKDVRCNDPVASLQGRRIALYGAGGIGYATGKILKGKGMNICCFIDDARDKLGTYVDGVEVLPLEDIRHDPGLTILICTPNPPDIFMKLTSQGYSNVRNIPVLMIEKNYYDTSLLLRDKDKIYKVFELLADDCSRLVFRDILAHRITMDFSYFDSIISQNQYFPDDIFKLSNKDCFVDGGAYHGETLTAFINAAGNNYEYIYAFEPDVQNFAILVENTAHLCGNRIKLVNSGLYSRTGEIGFNNLGNSGSAVSETGSGVISTVTLDETICEHQPTYIKLDIEGAEKEALAGMKKTITAGHPRLAVSIYHNAQDLWELPLAIHNMDPSYRIYVRHYMQGLNETVCYAI